jgi:succinate dehydrogenase / fumarate reductase flavoprotein subunit
LIGIIRTRAELEASIERLAELRKRLAKVSVEGNRQFNPGWHLALDLGNMLLVTECIAKAALLREESRGGHTRDDFPKMSQEWRKVNLVAKKSGDGVEVEKRPLPKMPIELLSLFEIDELSRYLTEEELTEVKGSNS